MASATTQLSVTAQGGNFGIDEKTAPTGSISAMISGTFGNFSELGRASASYGVLRSYGEAHFAKDNSGQLVFAGGTASFSEDFTFNSPGLTGQSGSLTFTLNIGGSLSSALKTAATESTSYSYALARLQVVKDSSSVQEHTTRLNSDGSGSTTPAPFLNQTSTHTVAFVFGTPFELEISLQASAVARSQFGADSISNLGNTLEWGGITGVKDGGGATVANYTTTTGSGTNYAQAIPEPGSAVLLVCGLAVPLLARRRK